MPTQYQFTLDNNEVIPHPTNWAEMSLGYSFDGELAGAKEISQLDFCSRALLDTFLAAIANEACAEYVLTIAYKCSPGDDYQEIFFTNLLVNKMKYQCDGCELIIPSRRHSIASRLEENADEELCFNLDTELEMIQVQSGGVIFTSEFESEKRNFISLLDLVNLFAIEYTDGGFTNLTGLVENDAASYEPAKAVIAPTSVPTGTTILTIVGEWGQTFTITVEPGAATIEDYLTRIAKALCYVPDGDNINLLAWDFIGRIGDFDIINDILTIRAYWNFQSVSLTVDGLVPTWFTEDITPQLKSSADIYISSKGMSGDEICITWSDLKELVLRLQGGIIRESGYNSEDFSFAPYSSLVDNLPTTGPEAAVISSAQEVEKSFNEEWYVKKLLAGQSFEVEDFRNDSDAQNWFWFGEQFPEVITSVTGVPNLVRRITVPKDCVGRPYGVLNLINNGTAAEDIDIEFYYNGNLIDARTYSNYPPGGVQTVNVGFGFPNLFVGYTYSAGDVLEFRLTNSGPNISYTEPSKLVFICEPCFREPFLDENTFTLTDHGGLSDFGGCSGSIDKRIPDKFYTGLGFAIDQVLQGLKEYEDKYFITYGLNGQTRGFPYCFYWDRLATQVCDVYKESFQTFHYHNAPIQLPNLLLAAAAESPSPVTFPAAQYLITIDANENISHSRNFITTPVPGGGKKGKLSFTACGGITDLIRTLNYGSVNIDLCGETGTAIIEDFDFNPDDHTVTYEVLI